MTCLQVRLLIRYAARCPTVSIIKKIDKLSGRHDMQPAISGMRLYVGISLSWRLTSKAYRCCVRFTYSPSLKFTWHTQMDGQTNKRGAIASYFIFLYLFSLKTDKGPESATNMPCKWNKGLKLTCNKTNSDKSTLIIKCLKTDRLLKWCSSAGKLNLREGPA